MLLPDDVDARLLASGVSPNVDLDGCRRAADPFSAFLSFLCCLSCLLFFCLLSVVDGLADLAADQVELSGRRGRETSKPSTATRRAAIMASPRRSCSAADRRRK